MWTSYQPMFGIILYTKLFLTNLEWKWFLKMKNNPNLIDILFRPIFPNDGMAILCKWYPSLLCLFKSKAIKVNIEHSIRNANLLYVLHALIAHGYYDLTARSLIVVMGMLCLFGFLWCLGYVQTQDVIHFIGVSLIKFNGNCPFGSWVHARGFCIVQIELHWE